MIHVPNCWLAVSLGPEEQSVVWHERLFALTPGALPLPEWQSGSSPISRLSPSSCHHQHQQRRHTAGKGFHHQRRRGCAAAYSQPGSQPPREGQRSLLFTPSERSPLSVRCFVEKVMGESQKVKRLPLTDTVTRVVLSESKRIFLGTLWNIDFYVVVNSIAAIKRV